MGKRRQSREEALKILYQMDLCKRKDLVEVFAFHWEQNPSPAEVKEFAQQLVIQTLQQQEEIDTTIQRFSKNWTLDRMSYIDRNILRMAVCELRFMQDIPAKVTINEAIEVAKRFGTEKSAIFINGVLDGIKNELGKV